MAAVLAPPSPDNGTVDQPRASTNATQHLSVQSSAGPSPLPSAQEFSPLDFFDAPSPLPQHPKYDGPPNLHLSLLQEPLLHPSPLVSPLPSPHPLANLRPTPSLVVTNMSDSDLPSDTDAEVDGEVPQLRATNPNLDRRISNISAASSTLRASSLFHDFDGTHYAHSPSLSPAPSPALTPRDNVGASNRSSLVPRASPGLSPGYPPPSPSMVYYPAPVPVTLNLPKRLSPGPSPHAEKKKQILASIKDEQSTPSPAANSPGADSSAPTASATGSFRLSDLSPHLRAAIFFEQQGSAQQVEIRNKSASATLDDLLDASTSAPVNVFTGHMFDPKSGRVFRKRLGDRRQVSMSGLDLARTDKQNNRDPSLNGLRVKSMTNETMVPRGLPSPNSPNSVTSSSKLRFSRSFSMGVAAEDGNLPRNEKGELMGKLAHRFKTPLASVMNADSSSEEGADTAKGPEPELNPYRTFGPNIPDLENFDDEDENPTNGLPTTLLAELQLRKKAQKLRNQNANTAYTNSVSGMRSTLLELDAVAQIQKRKRHTARVTLAWEAGGPSALHPDRADGNTNNVNIKNRDDDDDDDLPLAVLLAEKSVPKDPYLKDHPVELDRPFGLIQKRELEDNEPLSSRRARMRHEQMMQVLMQQQMREQYERDMYLHQLKQDLDADMQATAEAQPANRVETLAERVQRLKAEKNPLAEDTEKGDAEKAPEEVEVVNLINPETQQILEELGVDANDYDALTELVKHVEVLPDLPLPEPEAEAATAGEQEEKKPTDEQATPAEPAPEPEPESLEDLLMINYAAEETMETLGERRARLMREAAENVPPSAGLQPPERPGLRNSQTSSMNLTEVLHSRSFMGYGIGQPAFIEDVQPDNLLKQSEDLRAARKEYVRQSTMQMVGGGISQPQLQPHLQLQQLQQPMLPTTARNSTFDLAAQHRPPVHSLLQQSEDVKAARQAHIRSSTTRLPSGEQAPSHLDQRRSMFGMNGANGQGMPAAAAQFGAMQSMGQMPGIQPMAQMQPMGQMPGMQSMGMMNPMMNQMGQMNPAMNQMGQMNISQMNLTNQMGQMNMSQMNLMNPMMGQINAMGMPMMGGPSNVILDQVRMLRDQNAQLASMMNASMSMGLGMGMGGPQMAVDPMQMAMQQGMPMDGSYAAAAAAAVAAGMGAFPQLKSMGSMPSLASQTAASHGFIDDRGRERIESWRNTVQME